MIPSGVTRHGTTTTTVRTVATIHFTNPMRILSSKKTYSTPILMTVKVTMKMTMLRQEKRKNLSYKKVNVPDEIRKAVQITSTQSLLLPGELEGKEELLINAPLE